MLTLDPLVMLQTNESCCRAMKELVGHKLFVGPTMSDIDKATNLVKIETWNNLSTSFKLKIE